MLHMLLAITSPHHDRRFSSTCVPLSPLGEIVCDRPGQLTGQRIEEEAHRCGKEAKAGVEACGQTDTRLCVCCLYSGPGHHAIGRQEPSGDGLTERETCPKGEHD